METRYEKKYSPALGRDMEYKVYGNKGKGVLVFPSQDGRFYDYQDFDMVAQANRLFHGQAALLEQHRLHYLRVKCCILAKFSCRFLPLLPLQAEITHYQHYTRGNKLFCLAASCRYCRQR